MKFKVTLFRKIKIWWNLWDENQTFLTVNITAIVLTKILILIVKNVRLIKKIVTLRI